MSNELMKDDLVADYLDRLKADNQRLTQELKDKSRPVINIDFSNIKGIWDDIYRSDAWSVFSGLVFIIVLVAGSLITWDVLVPDAPPSPPKLLTGNFYVRGDNYNECYKVVQEYTDGGYMDNSPCIKDMEDAVKLRDKLDEAYSKSHSAEITPSSEGK